MRDRVPDLNSDPATQPDGTRGASSGRWLWCAAAVLLLLLVALVATTVVVRVHDQRDGASAGPSAPAALVRAREAAQLFFDLSPADVAQTTQRLLDLTTGTLHDDYAEQRSKLVTQVRRKQLTVTSTVPDGGLALEHLAGSRAQVLVAVDTTTTVGDKRESDNYRMRVVLEEVEGQWLVSSLEQVG